MTHRSIRAVALVLAGVFVAAACGGAGTAGPSASAAPTKPSFAASSYMATIQASGKLRVGTRDDNVPFGLKNPATGKYEGFDVDVARELAKALFGVADADSVIEYVSVVSATRIPTLNDNKADFVIATFTINDDRKKQIDFSDVYFRTGQKILVKKDNTSIKDVKDLGGKTVCTAKGSTSEKNITAQAPQATMNLQDTYAPCLILLQQGRVDAISTDETILFGLVKQDPNTKIVGGYFSDEPYGIGIKQGRTGFPEWMNAELKKMVADGRWAKIYKQWITPVSGDEKKNPEGK
jgi:putative glutamine transport system substrate-binding protein